MVSKVTNAYAYIGQDKKCKYQNIFLNLKHVNKFIDVMYVDLIGYKINNNYSTIPTKMLDIGWNNAIKLWLLL